MADESIKASTEQADSNDVTVAHDAWFRAEVETAIREADDPNCIWVSQEEVSRRLARIRTECEERINPSDSQQ